MTSALISATAPTPLDHVTDDQKEVDDDAERPRDERGGRETRKGERDPTVSGTGVQQRNP